MLLVWHTASLHVKGLQHFVTRPGRWYRCTSLTYSVKHPINAFLEYPKGEDDVEDWHFSYRSRSREEPHDIHRKFCRCHAYLREPQVEQQGVAVLEMSNLFASGVQRMDWNESL